MKSPIYREPNYKPEILTTLIKDAKYAIEDLERTCVATIPVYKGSSVCGYGLNGSQKSISCDLIISIMKEIKKIKGW